MHLEGDKRLNLQLRLDFSSAPTGEARQAGREDIESPSAVSEPERPANTRRIMEDVCERANLKEALRQVRSNKGSAGVDRMTVDQLGDYLKQNWLAIRVIPRFWTFLHSLYARARLNGNLELSRRINIVRHSRRAENHYAA